MRRSGKAGASELMFENPGDENEKTILYSAGGSNAGIYPDIRDQCEGCNG